MRYILKESLDFLLAILIVVLMFYRLSVTDDLSTKIYLIFLLCLGFLAVVINIALIKNGKKQNNAKEDTSFKEILTPMLIIILISIVFFL